MHLNKTPGRRSLIAAALLVASVGAAGAANAGGPAGDVNSLEPLVCDSGNYAITAWPRGTFHLDRDGSRSVFIVTNAVGPDGQAVVDVPGQRGKATTTCTWTSPSGIHWTYTGVLR